MYFIKFVIFHFREFQKLTSCCSMHFVTLSLKKLSPEARFSWPKCANFHFSGGAPPVCDASLDPLTAWGPLPLSVFGVSISALRSFFHNLSTDKPTTYRSSRIWACVITYANSNRCDLGLVGRRNLYFTVGEADRPAGDRDGL